jgi:hypothetical protein
MLKLMELYAGTKRLGLKPPSVAMSEFHHALVVVICTLRLPLPSAMATGTVVLRLRVALIPDQAPFSVRLLQRLKATGQSGVTVEVGVAVQLGVGVDVGVGLGAPSNGRVPML